MEWAPSGFYGFQRFNFRQNTGCFSFHAHTHAVIVGLSELARFEFKIQVAQVLIDHFFALIEISNARLVHAGFSITGGKKNVDQDACGKDATKHLDAIVNYSRIHSSVSWRARARKASRSGARCRSAVAMGAARSFQLRMRKRTSSNPNPSPAAGSIQASSSKPWVEGSTTAVTPQL